MNIFLATDHAGFELKDQLKDWFLSAGYTVQDFSNTRLDPTDDYPDFVVPLAAALSHEVGTFGIILGHSGQGEAMAANRRSGVRAAVYYGGSLELVRLTRQHNNANVLSLGAGFLKFEDAKKAIELFLSESFSGEDRHIRRIAKLDEPLVYDFAAEQ
jgi:ribose 5-phosphate isomerase B